MDKAGETILRLRRENKELREENDKFCRFSDEYLLEEIKETETELLAKIEQAERVVRDLYYRLAFKRINGYTLYLVNKALNFK